MCDKGQFSCARILAFISVSLASLLILIGLVTPDWTEYGGGFWTIKHDIPVLLTVSRVLALFACLGLVLAEVFFMGGIVFRNITRRSANILEAALLFLCTFCLMVAMIVFSHYRNNEDLGDYGYSFYMTCVGDSVLLVANMMSLLDLSNDTDDEHIPLT